jgi:polyferredoxin
LAKLIKIRNLIKMLWAAATNSYLVGFISGRIYGGPLKHLCVPGLNCYSCPGALFSCPIGGLQAVMGSRSYKFSFYIFGFLTAMGALCGRFICGWLCPFGWIQELLNRIPFPKKITAFRFDKQLRYLKYAILAVFVIALPLLLTDPYGQGEPFFCKLICPAGTLEAGLPLVALNAALRSTVGFLYAWKVILLTAVLFISIIIYRPFCKFLCPLGALYSLFNPISFQRLSYKADNCTDCGKCMHICGMNVDPRGSRASLECIRCGECQLACPSKALRLCIKNRPE